MSSQRAPVQSTSKRIRFARIASLRIVSVLFGLIGALCTALLLAFLLTKHYRAEERRVPAEATRVDRGRHIHIHAALQQPARDFELLEFDGHVQERRAGDGRARECLIVRAGLWRAEALASSGQAFASLRRTASRGRRLPGPPIPISLKRV